MPFHVNLTARLSHELPSHGLVALLALATLTNLVVLALALVAAQAAHGDQTRTSGFQALEERMVVQEWLDQGR
jgi:hypothetical protein